jgi:hypothetical protein
MKKEASKYPQCKTCICWKNKQSELDYINNEGICTSGVNRFDVRGEGDVKVLDRSNRTDKFMGVQRFENRQITIGVGSNVEHSRYLLITEENYGCINHLAE